jgi:hypothetical protein
MPQQRAAAHLDKVNLAKQMSFLHLGCGGFA